MKVGVLFGVIVPLALVSTAAFADDKAVCVDAASRGQSLRSTHQLVEARGQFLVCASGRCPSVVKNECADWLTEVDRTLPSVVITAKDDAGRDLVDVTVSVDGRPLTSKLQGVSLPLDPGVHALHFETGTGMALDRQVLVKEGAKNQDVAVVLARRAPISGTPSGAAGVGIPWRAVGWVSGAAGVVGLLVGAGFGVKATSDKSSAHCDSSNACDAGPLHDANTSATVSTVGIALGAVLLAGGAALVWFVPKRDAPSASAARLTLRPLLGARDAGLSLGGSW